MPECEREFSYMPNIGFDAVHHLVNMTRKDQFSHGQSEANNLVGSDVGGQRNRIWIGHHVNERRTRMLKSFFSPEDTSTGFSILTPIMPIASASFAKFGFFRSVWKSGSPRLPSPV